MKIPKAPIPSPHPLFSLNKNLLKLIARYLSWRDIRNVSLASRKAQTICKTHLFGTTIVKIDSSDKNFVSF